MIKNKRIEGITKGVGIFKVFLHKGVFDQLDALPATRLASVIRQFRTIQNYGVTELLPGRIRFGWKNDFFAFAPQKNFSVKNDDGAQIWGFWKEDFDQSFYVYNIREVLDGGNWQGGSWYSLLARTDKGRPDDLKEYSEIDENWIDEKRNGAFVRKADGELNYTNRAGGTQSLYMEQICFYRKVKYIFEFAKLAELHGSDTPWPISIGATRAERIVFNASSRFKPSALTLKDFINALANQPHKLVFVNFIDAAQHVLCDAHSQLINLITFYLKEDFTNLSIKIIDVIIRDESGTKLYLRECQEYFKTNKLGDGGTVSSAPGAPFVMVIGCPGETQVSYVTDLKTKQGLHRFDFDLFHGRLAAENDRELDEFFKKNVRRAIYGAMRLAGVLTDNAMVFHRDLRGLPQEEAMEMRWDIEDSHLVVKLHTKKQSVFQGVVNAVAQLKLTGCPYVSMILADGPKDIIEVHDDTNTFTQFFDVENWKNDDFYGFAERIRAIYANHKLNGAAPLPFDPVGSQETAFVE